MVKNRSKEGADRKERIEGLRISGGQDPGTADSRSQKRIHTIRSQHSVVMNSHPLPSLLRCLPPLVAVALALHHGPALIDDAYITFRYGENLAAGHGLVFNPGQWVLGTSSPLMALLVATGIALGVSAPLTALILSVLAVAALVHVIEVLAREVLAPWWAWAVAMTLALHPALAFAANSGMETALSMLAVYGAIALALRGRARSAGLAAGLATLLRPDGAVVIALLLAWSAWRARRQFAPMACAAALVVVPAALAAWAYYGGLAPHSVAAKQLIHADGRLPILLGTLHHLVGLPVLMVVGALAVVGLFALLRTGSGLLLVPAWLLLQTAGLVSARISPIFPWYFCPFHPGLVLLAGIGLALLGERYAQRAVRVGLALLAGALLIGGPEFERRFGDPDMVRRTGLYLELGRELAATTPAGGTVFVGEVGALAWAMPAQRIIDSAGINSPEVYAARRRDHERLLAGGGHGDLREGSPDWVKEVIAATDPLLVVTMAPWLHIEALARAPDFAQRYERVAWPRQARLHIYRKRDGAGREP